MKKFISLLVSCGLILGCGVPVFALDQSEDITTTSENLHAIEFDDSVLVGAIMLSEETFVENGRMITVTEYQTAAGDIITDTFERSAIVPYSKNGTDTATRSRDLGDYGVVTVTASFQWYTDSNAGIIGVRYVRCTGMSAKHTGASSLVEVSQWETDYSSEYKSFGTAYAQVSYYMYNKNVPMQYQSGTVKITCDDTGSISDNA